jgi:hypothetical protein
VSAGRAWENARSRGRSHQEETTARGVASLRAQAAVTQDDGGGGGDGAQTIRVANLLREPRLRRICHPVSSDVTRPGANAQLDGCGSGGYARSR